MGRQEELFEAELTGKYDRFSREDLIAMHKIDRRAIEQYRQLVRELQSLKAELEEKVLLINDQRIWLRSELFGKSSEKSPKSHSTVSDDESPASKAKSPRVQCLSERYPNLPRIIKNVGFETIPDCGACGHKLCDSGMTEDSEFLTVIPKQYFIVEQKRHKYRCQKCHGDLQTAPCPKRITAGGSYSDAMVLDVAISKYCDLIPIGRYARMAERSGVANLPPQSLIEATHHLAEFLKPTYELLRKEIRAEKVLHADETPHRMLEGDEKSHWYLWGFSSKRTSYFEAHDTRSGDVASNFLKDSSCQFLMSDVFSGYGRAVRESNLERDQKGLPKIQGIYCNAHARRRFKEAKERFPDDAQFFIDEYQKIYQLEATLVDKPPEQILDVRNKMGPHFDAMRSRAMDLVPIYPEKSAIGKALAYLLKNFKEFTAFTGNAELPIDNNPQERLLRNPVIGRKTWYGTHSKRGAETMTVLFSIVESCKLNRVNPREFLKQLVDDIQQGKAPYTPASLATL